MTNEEIRHNLFMASGSLEDIVWLYDKDDATLIYHGYPKKEECDKAVKFVDRLASDEKVLEAIRSVIEKEEK